MGYHVETIEKGVLGEISKITEEVLELVDAAKQGIRLMELLELSDLYGAIESYLDTHHKSYTMEDLAKMSAATKSAFQDGTRQ